MTGIDKEMQVRFSVGSRRVMFRALVIAIEAGEREVTTESVAAALLQSPELSDIFERMGLSPTVLTSALELSTAAEHLRHAELSLAERSIPFGSAEHIGSIEPLRLSAEAQDIVSKLVSASIQTQEIVTPLYLMEAFVSEVPALRAKASAHGLTAAAIRAAFGPPE